MKTITVFQRVALIAVLVLPALVYIIFVYGQNEVFFQTLEYVGERGYDEENEDTLFYEIPAFELVSAKNESLTKEVLDSTIYVVSFFFTTCPSICPAMNFHLNEIESRFKGYPDFKLLSITVDPNRDSTEALASYQKERNYSSEKWMFATGGKEQIYDLAKGLFLNAFEDQTAEGGFLHSTNAIIVDWNGRIRSRKDDSGNIVGSYDVLDITQLNDLESDIKVLIAEYERDKHNLLDD
ncbi:SCO family protein [Schleiferiaceae bacterium]|jgi:protein SCO1|nr:SCO family protein [Flavobacteriales bacterium]MDC1022609.1 SCO family protein [Schleiferiaceae bacterium]|tara:strand:- start:5231 stop:5944 length:714 start_codon:yes stop_codon:yes gene_type:complete